MNMARLLLSIGFLSGLSVSCATTRFPNWDQSHNAPKSGSVQESQQLEVEGDGLFAERKSLEKLKAALMKWEIAALMAPSERLFSKLAYGHYLCAERSFGLGEEGNDSFAHYSRGLGFAEQGIRLILPALPKSAPDDAQLKTLLLSVPQSGARLLYWYAKNLEKWAQHHGALTLIRYRSVFALAFKKALEFNNDVESYAHLSDSTEINKR